MTIAAGIFRQNDVRGIVDKDLTEEAAHAIGGAYAALMKERGVTGAVAVGRDNRPSGENLRNALVEGFTSAGVDVVDIAIVPTPVMYWSLHHLPVIGGVVTTGIRNPAVDNVLKPRSGIEVLDQHLTYDPLAPI